MSKKKDFLFLLQYFYPEYISSATLPFDTASKLTEKGYTVDVLCGYPHEYCEEKNIHKTETVNKIFIRRVKYLQLSRKKKIGRLVNYLSLNVSIFFRFLTMRKYKTIIVYSNPPILPLIAALASKLFKCKLVFVAYDLYPEVALRTGFLSENSIITKFMNYINNTVYVNAEDVIALSSEMKNYIVQNRKIAEQKVHVIPNWYKDEYCTEEKIRENIFHNIVQGRFVIGYFGNMGIAQDMEPIKEAIRFYKNSPELCFLLAGHGSKHSQIEYMIKEEKINNVFLYNFLRGDDYLDALRISNCAIVSLEKGLTGLCVPSKTYAYMMQGLPIIAIMDESDIVQAVQEGAGYHIEGNSRQALVDLIAKIKNEPAECEKKGRISRKIYQEKYTPEKCLDEYLRILNRE